MQANASHFIVYSILALLQLVNDGPVSTFTTRDIIKFLSRKFFREGELEKDMICQYCPGHRVVRRHQGSPNTNLMRHVKRFHTDELKRVVEGDMVDRRRKEQLQMYMMKM